MNVEDGETRATLGPGDAAKLEHAMQQMYAELRRIAQGQMSGEAAAHTLQPTALVNEAYGRLARNEGFQWQNQAHFLGIAAGVMRQVLVDYARKRNAAKRGSGVTAVTLHEDQLAHESNPIDVLALDAALVKLEALNSDLARLVELRFFGGLNHEALMETLGQSRRTLDKNWAFARAWLSRELG